MVTRAQWKQVEATFFVFVGGVLAIISWLFGGSDGILLIVVGIFIMGIGFATWRGQNKHTSYILTVTGIFLLILSTGRALIYSPTNGLAVAFFVLAVALFFRSYQYYQAS